MCSSGSLILEGESCIKSGAERSTKDSKEQHDFSMQTSQNSDPGQRSLYPRGTKDFIFIKVVNLVT